MPTTQPKATNAGRQQPCSRCGSRNVARVMYGYPAYSERLERELVTGETRLGGCVVWPDQPKLVCHTCGLEMLADGTEASAPES